MNVTLLVAAISSVVSIAVAILSYYPTKRKEREADWRKIKLNLYRAYVLALSGVVKANKTAEDQARHADALNALTLVASPNVLRALYAFMDAVSASVGGEGAIDREKHLDDLIKALRQDHYSAPNGRAERVQMRFMAP